MPGAQYTRIEEAHVGKLKAGTFAFQGLVTTLNPQGMGTVLFDRMGKAKRAPDGYFDLVLIGVDEATRAKVQVGERVKGTARRGVLHHRILTLEMEV